MTTQATAKVRGKTPLTGKTRSLGLTVTLHVRKQMNKHREKERVKLGVMLCSCTAQLYRVHTGLQPLPMNDIISLIFF